jgi:hypothetical protein
MPFSTAGNVVFGDYPTDDGIDEFKPGTAGQGLHDDPAVAVLAMSTGLFFVFPLNADLLFDRFTIGNFWRLSRTSTLYLRLQFSTVLSM